MNGKVRLEDVVVVFFVVEILLWMEKVTRRTEDGTGIGYLEFKRVKLNVSWNPGKLNTLLVELNDNWTIGLLDSKIFQL